MKYGCINHVMTIRNVEIIIQQCIIPDHLSRYQIDIHLFNVLMKINLRSPVTFACVS